LGTYYTIQRKETWEEAKNKGYLIGHEKFVWDEFKKPYQWMIEQMNLRIGHDGTYPIWLWLEKPELNQEGYLEKGVEGVCLTVEVPDHQVY
jgi:hypothetical protein